MLVYGDGGAGGVLLGVPLARYPESYTGDGGG